MTVKLETAELPIDDVLQLRSTAKTIYLRLWQSASKDNHGSWGGTTFWSIKGLAAEIGSKRETVSTALAQLLDAGLIAVAGYIPTNGTKKTVWRVIHPSQIKAQRYAISVMGQPSLRWKVAMKPAKVKAVEPDDFVAWLSYKNKLVALEAESKKAGTPSVEMLRCAGFKCEVEPIKVREIYSHRHESSLRCEIDLAIDGAS